MSDNQPPEPAGPSPAERWFRLAEDDLAAARIILEGGGVALRVAGFLAQQTAEKALKAGLIARNVDFPKIHDLGELHDRFPSTARPEIDVDDLDLLDPWIIDGRYAANLPEVEIGEATKLVEAAARVLEALRSMIE